MKIFNLLLSSCLLAQGTNAYSILKTSTPAKASASDEIEPSTTSRRNLLRSAAALSAGALLANINTGVAMAADDVATPVYFGVGVRSKVLRQSCSCWFSDFCSSGFGQVAHSSFMNFFETTSNSVSGTSSTSLSFREKRIFWAESPANTHRLLVTPVANPPTRRDAYAITTFRELRITANSATEKWLV